MLFPLFHTKIDFLTETNWEFFLAIVVLNLISFQPRFVSCDWTLSAFMNVTTLLLKNLEPASPFSKRISVSHIIRIIP